MDKLRLAQIFSHIQLSSRWRLEMLKEIDVDYCVQDEPNRTNYTKNKVGSMYLHAAATKLYYDIVDELLNKGADLLKQTLEDGRTPLLLVIDSYTLKNQFTIWRMLGELKHEMVAKLLSAQVKTGNALNSKDKSGISHFHVACAVNHTEAVEFFLTAGALVDQVTNDEYACYLPGYTALHFAIRYSAVETVQLLMEHGADIHLKDGQSRSSLHMIIERLMDLADYINMGKRACWTVCKAEIDKIRAMVRIIFNSKTPGDMNFIDDTGLTALHVACALTDKSIIETLLKQNVNINASVHDDADLWPGYTPLHFAACLNVENVKLLLQRGSLISKNAAGKTPLDLCMERYSPEIIHSILSCKPEFANILMSDGSTRLVDILMLMNDCDKFNNFLQNSKNVELCVPHGSPLWPGNTLLHLSILMNEKTKTLKEFYESFIPEETTVASPESYNCSEKEELAYWKRIVICLVRGCSLTTKNTEGLTPVHLAFKLRKANVVDKFLNSCKSDAADPNNLTHFHIACVIGKKTLVERLLSEGANVNGQVRSSFDWYSKHGIPNRVPFSLTVQANSTPLHLAVIFEHHEIVELLLQNNADVYAQEARGFTPIHLSMKLDAKLRPIAQSLFNAAGQLKEVVSKENLTHLHVAAWANHGQAVNDLLESGSDVDAVFDYTEKRRKDYRDELYIFARETPLYTAVRQCSANAVRALILAGADISKRIDVDEATCPLIQALDYMDSDVGKCVVRRAKREFKDIIGSVDENGVTMLHVACASFDIIGAKKLMEMGADVNARIRDDDAHDYDIWRGQTPLHVLINEACNAEKFPKNFMKFVRLMLKRGADVTVKDCTCTPLHEIHQMIRGENKELFSSITDLFLKRHKSYDVNPTDNTGFSHFHVACIRNKAKIVKKFLDNGVDVNHRVDDFSMYLNSGYTSLHFALECQHVDLARMLIDRGADVNAEATNGNRPLHVALFKNCMDMDLLEVFYRKGADFNAKNLKDMTPLMYLFMLKNYTLEQLNFFLKRNSRFDATHFQSLQGIIGLAMKNAKPSDRELIFHELMKTADVTSAIDAGFNAIHSIVSINQDGSLTEKVYVDVIKQLVKMGCNLNQQNENGKAPIHDAAYFYNWEASKALLRLGADINVVNAKNESPLCCSVIADDKVTKERKMNALRVLLTYAWKMKLLELPLESSIEERVSSMSEKELFFCNIHRSRIQNEFEKMESLKISDTFTAKSFMYEGVSTYHLVALAERKKLDKFFENIEHISQLFPYCDSLLSMQYRKAVFKLKSLDFVEEC